ncbi:unnamed protein product [Ostreobium quekettii]|uniref:Ribokinase n=1 Tax=Ostreobium quekettii TaxID=121088 RepID=A0A8S1INY3_9CHLO|nr:unnamed protein product [Ostreobium quekettii]
MADRRGPLVVVGSVNADLVLQVDRVPAPGETIGAESLDTFPGGKGANQAAAAAKLGYPTYLVGQVGSDANAEFLKASLLSCGVNLSFLKKVKGPSGTAVVMLQPSGENSIVIVGGANQHTWSLGADVQQSIMSAGAVLLQREIPDNVNEAVAKVAQSAGVPVILDAGGVDAPLTASFLPLISILSPNETELARLTGMPTDTMDHVEAAARQLLQHGPERVLVKLGSQGALLVTGDATTRVGALPVAKVVDTTGAGDCFTAAFVVALLEGSDPKEAMEFATLAASICIQRKGAMSSLPLREELTAGWG